MHPIITYELVKTRMEQARQAECCRIAQAEMPRVPQSSASILRQLQQLRNAIPRTQRSEPVTEVNPQAKRDDTRHISAVPTPDARRSRRPV